jgi:hypothetical protein
MTAARPPAKDFANIEVPGAIVFLPDRLIRLQYCRFLLSSARPETLAPGHELNIICLPLKTGRNMPI